MPKHRPCAPHVLQRQAAHVAAGLLAALCAVAALANPCPPPPPPLPAPPPYAMLTGSVTVSGADSIAAGVINTCLVDGGTIDVTGTLTNNGMLTITPGGGALNVLAGGRYVNAAGATFVAVAGSVSNDGTLANAGVFDPTTAFSNGGTLLNLAGGQLIEVGAMTSSGSMANSGDLRLTGPIGFTSSLQSSGTFSNLAGGTFSVILNATMSSSGSFDNAGTVHNTGRIDNLATGTFSNTGTLVNGDPTGQVSGALANAGSLLNSGAAARLANNPGSTLTLTGTLRNEAGAALVNTGIVDHQAGLLTNAGIGTNFTNGHVVSVGSAGRIQNLAGATFDNAAVLTLQGGRFDNAALLNNRTAASIDNAGTLSNVDGMIANANGATITNRSRLENGSSSPSVTGAIDNHGSIVNAGAFANQAGGTLTNHTDGTLLNQSAGVWTNEAGALVEHAGSWVNDGTLRNAGTLRLSADLTGSGTFEQTAGLTKLLGATIEQSAIDIRGGQLLGAGTIVGPVTLSGGATLGAGDPQVLVVKGSLSASDSNVLVQIAGPAAFDVIHVVGGGAVLDAGTVTFQFLSGYVPAAGTRFTGFLTADGGISGLGSEHYRLLGLPKLPGFRVEADGVGLDLVVAGPVPEPRSMLLMLTGIAALVGLRRPLREAGAVNGR